MCTADERAKDLITEAEQARAEMFEVEGKSNPTPVSLGLLHKRNIQLIDNDYQMIDAHVDEAMRKKIVNYEYVDLSKLLVKNKNSREEDNRLEFVTKNGMTFLAPVSDRDVSGGINSDHKWEQAFRVYSNILTTSFPEKATELLQHNHTIQTASLSYQWENVYSYNKEFRYHISRHPYRAWNVLLQQAWMMLLKDCLRQQDHGPFHKQKYGKKESEPCRRFNKGKCTIGLSCKFEHRCSVKRCGKFRHGAWQCHLRGREGEKLMDKPSDIATGKVEIRK